MKVALCISGMPRSFKKTYRSVFQYLIDIYQPDVFISTWRSERTDEMYPETDSPEEMVEIYKPKRFDIEIFNDARKASLEDNCFKENADQGGKTVARMMAMFYKIFLADMHRFMYEQEHRFTYDVVIRCRADLTFHAPVELEMPQARVIYFPKMNSQNLINDQLWYCDSKTSVSICNLYAAIPELWYRGIIIHGETLLLAWSLSQDYIIKPIDIHYELTR